jgi:hypothetical protein
MLGGWFYERSSKAGSYRGELLGLVAIHLLTAFASEYYATDKCSGNVYCDNKGALGQASKNRQRVRTGAKHADLLRALRSIKARCPMSFYYTHVRAHQDKYLSWRALTLVEQLNVTCDSLASQAVTYGMSEGAEVANATGLLPREHAAILFQGEKLTSDISSEVRHLLGKEEARNFFTAPSRIVRGVNKGGLGWSAKKFDSIDWLALRDALAGKSDMFGIWLSKQTIGICATWRNLARITGTTDDRCPDCLCGPKRHDHLLQCSSPGRTKLFDDDVADLYSWMTHSG